MSFNIWIKDFIEESKDLAGCENNILDNLYDISDLLCRYGIELPINLPPFEIEGKKYPSVKLTDDLRDALAESFVHVFSGYGSVYELPDLIDPIDGIKTWKEVVCLAAVAAQIQIEAFNEKLSDEDDCEEDIVWRA